MKILLDSIFYMKSHMDVSQQSHCDPSIAIILRNMGYKTKTLRVKITQVRGYKRKEK